MSHDVFAQLGRVGLPAPVAELAAREWDAIVVGGGHNGLTAAAYLARAGHRVLVLEQRERLGGAATLERPFADQRFIVSPCAYLVGLLDPVVISELELERHGYHVTPADPNLWCPFDDGSSYAGFLDPARTTEYLRGQGFADAEIAGVSEFGDVFDRIRDLLRAPDDDLWQRPSANREEIEERLGGDPELISIVFEESIATMLDRYVTDQRLKDAIACQGTIGTFAGPRDPGTAAIRLMHRQGNLGGLGSVWGYVRGGLGRASFAIAQSALDSGAVLATGVGVSAIVPGEGVELESGERIATPVVICNADPKRMLAMLEAGRAELPGDYRERLEGWDVRSPVMKLNVALNRFPHFPAAPEGLSPERAQVTITGGVDAAQAAVESARRGEPAIGFCELYFQSAYDRSVVPDGSEVMSVFCQYVPYALAEGDWNSRRDEIAAMAIDAIEARAPDIRDCITEIQVMGPPDIEERIGLSGGHIFQGQALPAQMWDRRLEARTPIEGLYLCGAATHPGGSVIALNGRIAANEVLTAAPAAA
ncbi:MAG: NAD(P)/FAD-dependent oxidoreductase [Solirubrobacterales bacterium]